MSERILCFLRCKYIVTCAINFVNEALFWFVLHNGTENLLFNPWRKMSYCRLKTYAVIRSLSRPNAVALWPGHPSSLKGGGGGEMFQSLCLHGKFIQSLSVVITTLTSGKNQNCFLLKTNSPYALFTSYLDRKAYWPNEQFLSVYPAAHVHS